MYKRQFPILSLAFSNSIDVVAEECLATLPSEICKCASRNSFSKCWIRFVYSAAMVAAVAYGMDSIEEDTFPLELVEFVDVSSSRCKRTEDASMIIYSYKHYSFSIDQFSINQCPRCLALFLLLLLLLRASF